MIFVWEVSLPKKIIWIWSNASNYRQGLLSYVVLYYITIFIRLKSAIKLIVIKLERKFRLDLEWFNQIGILFQPQNIVLMSEFPNCEIKLCDLEVSRVIQDHEEIREIIGTPDYVGMLS